MTEQKIGRYEIKEELGRGGMATVYKAYDPRFEREVAIKILPRELLHDPQFRIRFDREAKTIAHLEHPAIVPVYDVGEEDGQPYFVMRCMTGGSLANSIARGPMPLNAVVKIIDRLAPALDEAHSKGIVHRDLKPGNILFDQAGVPYISDFGIAKMTQSQSTNVTGSAIVGTPAYMSPEQAQGEEIDGRSDVYALGVIVFEMLTGTQPYQSTTPMGVVLKQITEPVPRILEKAPDLPPVVQAIIEKAMAKKPSDRFSTAGELSAALSNLAHGGDATVQVNLPNYSNETIIAPGRTVIKTAKTNLPRKSAPGAAPEASPQEEPAPARRGVPALVFIMAGLAGICLLAVAASAVFKMCLPLGPLTPPWCSSPPPATVVSQQGPVTTLPTNTATLPPTLAPTLTLAPVILPSQTNQTATPSLPPPPPVIGGADKVAFIATGQIWQMNMDGSGLLALTDDKSPKINLQWVPGTNQIVYISGTNIQLLDAATKKVETIASFPNAVHLEEFQVSPDGKQVAISLNREIYIVPYDIPKLSSVHDKRGLIAMKGCLSYSGNSLSAVLMKKFRWSSLSTNVAWLFIGVGSNGKTNDLIRLQDISHCDPAWLTIKDEFPGSRFTMEGYSSNPVIPNFDWDGDYMFLMNTFDRNGGWGFLYSYSNETHIGREENPLGAKTRCCYRDARFSPDGSHVFFAFQNKDLDNAPIQLFYVTMDQLHGSGELQPISLPANLFSIAKEAPQITLHRAPGQ